MNSTNKFSTKRDYKLVELIVVVLLLVGLVNSAKSNTVVLSSETQHVNLVPSVAYLIEPDRKLTIEEILSPAIQKQFIQAESEEINFGFVDNVYWFKVSIQDESSSVQAVRKWIMELDFNYIDHYELYVSNGDGSFSKSIGGDNYLFNIRAIQHYSHLFPLLLDARQKTDIYFRINTSTSLQFPLELYSVESFIEKNTVSMFAHGIFYGLLLVMIVYNLFVYMSVRDPAYLFYICYIASAIAMYLTVNGMAYQFLWPKSPLMANIGFTVACTLTLFFGFQFTRYFLNTSANSARLDKILKSAALFFVVAAVGMFFVSLSFSVKWSIMSLLPGCSLILFAGIYRAIKGDRRAYFFLLAWSFLVVGVLIRSLVQLDVLPANFFTLHSAEFGCALEVVLLSFALADRINQERSNRLKAVEGVLVANEERRKTEQALMFYSLHDQLTGAPNRIHFIQRLHDYLTQSNDQQNRLLICTIHLKNFHDINFTLGHQAGDQILKEAVSSYNLVLSSFPGIKSLNMETQDASYVAVIEGVYLAFIIGVHQGQNETDLLNEVQAKLSSPVPFKDMTLDLGGNIGVSIWPQDAKEADSLMRKSMISVRAAKWANLPLVSFAPELDNYSESRLLIMAELVKAIENDELELFYQPKLCLRTKEVKSVEALIRWHHPKRGLLSPVDFIDIAESTGVIQDLTSWVLKSGVAFASDLRAKGYDISVAINISVRNLLNEDFGKQVMECVDSYDLPPEKLVVEVIESSVIEDMKQSSKNLTYLSAKGVQIALDDFGTGYSSLSYLKNLPVDELKIDRSFVMDLTSNKQDRVIVQTTLAIAQELGLRVIAEGIEDEKTIHLLDDMHCHYGQGYFIARPLPAADLLSWFDSNEEYRPKRINEAAPTDT